MTLLSLMEQRRIANVINYLIEIHQKSDTVEDVMQKFGLTLDEYRMCCNLGMPALAMRNMQGRFEAVRSANKSMRRDIKALYDALKDEDGPGAEGIRMLYDAHCSHGSGVVYGTAQDEEPDEDEEEKEEE